ncbi:MAG: fabG 4 [Hyphomicrobiales bacterium]|nr:fabG 4 [Hyphomicrobiales bacterium]
MSKTASQYPPGAYVVTGAGSGIGREMTRLLLERGASVSAWDMNLGDLPGTQGERLQTHTVDVRDKAAVTAAMASAHARFGALAGIATCAGIFRPKPFLELEEKDWDDHFDINLKGTLFCCQAALPIMRSQARGAMVLFSSTLARSPKPGVGHYAATKGGVLGLMRVLALETARQGVRVNAVSPGLADTPMPRAVYGEAMSARASENPMGRLGLPQDMAEAALFLFSDDASYVTGQDIRVTGGKDVF